MKKVISNLVYNTETAKLLGSRSSGLPGDINYLEESLYIKRTGEYFLHGSGGANTIYAVWEGNSGRGGENIRPYTLEEAREWAEAHLTADEYAAAFGEPEESTGGKVQLNLYITPESKAKLEKRRQATGKSISQIIDEMVEAL